MTLLERAEETVREILRTQYDGVSALRLDSPPGAGKTDVVERVAVQDMADLGERCMVVTQTNEQAFDLAARFSENYDNLPFTLFARSELPVPRRLLTLRNLQVARRSSELPAGPCVVVGNAWRWSWCDDGAAAPFDVQIVDEAFQLPDHRFHQIAGMAARHVLVGDPGQIQPLITCKIERWVCDPAGPHVPAPRALTSRHRDVMRMSLPVSRRLLADTVEIIQPAFYRELPFAALSGVGERRLVTRARGATPFDEAVDLAEAGASLVQVELPPLTPGEVDEELADAMVATAARFLRRRALVVEGDAVRTLDASMIGVVCAHVSQVNAVRERLPQELTGVFVETANRFQGLEKPVMLVYHPLSGRTDGDEFHMDAGRLCVMLTRHRAACFVFTRGGVEEMLTRHAPAGNRVLGSEDDAEYEGWRANMTVARELRVRSRVVKLR